MSTYGDPRRPNKHEVEAGDMIYKVEKAIRDWLSQNGHVPGPSIRVDPQTYYDPDNQPSRTLEMGLGPRSTIRVLVERQSAHKKRAKWVCYWTVFTSGKNIEEGYFDADGISQVAPELTKKIIARYEYAIG